jgi:hypothetical protein
LPGTAFARALVFLVSPETTAGVMSGETAKGMRAGALATAGIQQIRQGH